MAVATRKGWVAVKTQMEKSLGKDFVKSAFKQDLGPTLDKLDGDLDKLLDEAQSLDKALAKLAERKGAFVKDFLEVRSVLADYARAIEQEAKKKKVDAGPTDKLDQVLFRRYRSTYTNGFQPLVRKMGGAVDSCSQKGGAIS